MPASLTYSIAVHVQTESTFSCVVVYAVFVCGGNMNRRYSKYTAQCDSRLTCSLNYMVPVH